MSALSLVFVRDNALPARPPGYCRGGIVPPALSFSLPSLDKEGADRSRRVF
jgi:hypothetical protein